MQERPRYVFVLFATGESRSRWQRFVHWCIRTVTRSPLVHVAVEYDETVLNASFRGISLLSGPDFHEKTPDLAWRIDVPVTVAPDLIWWHQFRPKKLRVITVITRWLTCGLTPSRDCVAVVAAVLRSAGVVVPRRITTPGRLFDWLRARGYSLHGIP